MICPACGSTNIDTAAFCQQCGKPLRMQQHPQPGAYPRPPQPGQYYSVPNYLVQAILVTIFCCLPFGIAAIVYAAQVNTKLAAGDYTGAMLASKNAKLWSWVAFGVGLTGILIYFFIVVVGIFFGAMGEY